MLAKQRANKDQTGNLPWTCLSWTCKLENLLRLCLALGLRTCLDPDLNLSQTWTCHGIGLGLSLGNLPLACLSWTCKLKNLPHSCFALALRTCLVFLDPGLNLSQTWTCHGLELGLSLEAWTWGLGNLPLACLCWTCTVCLGSTIFFLFSFFMPGLACYQKVWVSDFYCPKVSL